MPVEVSLFLSPRRSFFRGYFGCRSDLLLPASPKEQVAPMNFQIDKALEILKQTPATLESLLGSLSSEWTQCDEGPDTWSPFDVLGHLIHGEETDWVPRLKIILEYGESKTFTPFDRFAQFEHSRGKTLPQLLQEFGRLRGHNLEDLKALNLQPEQLDLTGMHPELGKVTVRQLLATWTVHDLTHIAQIVRTLGKAYSVEVGPWKAYLGILQR